MTQLSAILVAIIVGYSCKRLPFSLAILNRFLALSILLILVIMGYEFGSKAANLTAELYALGKIVCIFVVCIFGFNFLSISLTCRKFKCQYSCSGEKASVWLYIKSSSKYLIYVILGIIFGYFLKFPLHYLDHIISGLLLCILFVIGYQLKAQNIALKSIILNKIGLVVALTITLSSMGAGIAAGLLSGLSIKTGLVLGSGFGWYTLSGIITGELINQQMGTAAFFIDFSRELVALVMVPVLGQKYPLQSVGYCAATALDYTLPVIKENMGEEVVPVAIASGMILTIIVPILIPIVWQF